MKNGNDFSRRQAILVIHGIGRQQRFTTLDRFTNRLTEVLEPDRVVHFTRRKGELFEHFVRLAGKREIDLYEYYWAPKTEAQISFGAVLQWMLKTGLTPIRQLAFNLPLVMKKAIHDAGIRARKGRSSEQVASSWAQQVKLGPLQGGERLSRVLEVPAGAWVVGGRSWRRFRALALWGFFRELLRVMMVTLLTLAVVGSIIWLITRAGSLATLDTWGILASAVKPLGLDVYLRGAAALGASVLAFALFKSLGQQRRDLARAAAAGDPDRPDEIGARRLFLAFSILLLGGLLALFLLLAASLAEPAKGLIRVARSSPELLNMLLIIVIAAAAFWVRRLLKDYVADIALYTAADERSPFVKIRGQILEEAAERIDWLLGRGYESVAVAGHSLGSVIAYDAIAQLAYEAQLPPGEQGDRRPAERKRRLERLKFLITFGSPLNKVLYFFRTIVKDQETVRAKILARLYGFRRPRELFPSGFEIGSGIDLGDHVLELDDGDSPLGGLFWLNVYSPLDIVSAPLVFYEGVIDYRRWGGHMSYWTDYKFYEEVAAVLEHRILRAPVPVWLDVASRHQSIYHVSSRCVYAQQIQEENRVFGEGARRKRTPHEDCPALRRFRAPGGRSA